MILDQVWAVWALAQLWPALRGLVAATAQVDPCDVSRPLVIRDLPQDAARGRGQDPIAAFAAAGGRLGVIRPARRSRIATPLVPVAARHPPPTGVRLVRIPRSAHRTCDPQAHARASPGK